MLLAYFNGFDRSDELARHLATPLGTVENPGYAEGYYASRLV
ncbi:MAG: hypothetical protein R3F37_09725 [Candidatus Competibacteraceae bacterium]